MIGKFLGLLLMIFERNKIQQLACIELFNKDVQFCFCKDKYQILT